MKTKNPIGIKVIGWLQILGALVVLFTLNVEETQAFNARFAIHFIPESIVQIIPEVVIQILLVIFSIIISYGYLKQTKWGYWSMLIYSILVCCISLFQATNYNNQQFVGNIFYSGIVAVYTLLHFRYFNRYVVINK